MLFDHDLVVYGSFLAIAITWWVFYRTRAGLNLRASVGVREGAFARRINVNTLRFWYTVLGRGHGRNRRRRVLKLDVKLRIARETLTLESRMRSP